jgi:hypothetical protein
LGVDQLKQSIISYSHGYIEDSFMPRASDLDLRFDSIHFNGEVKEGSFRNSPRFRTFECCKKNRYGGDPSGIFIELLRAWGSHIAAGCVFLKNWSCDAFGSGTETKRFVADFVSDAFF